jgi:biotin carboxylase
VTPRGRAFVIGGIGVEQLAYPKEMGVETVFVQQPDRLTDAQREIADELHVVDFGADPLAPLAVAREVHARAPLDFVVAMAELGLEPAAMVAEALGLPGTTSVATARLLRDKARMRALLREQGISPVTATLCTDLADAEEAARRMTMPVIVKPRDGSGSFAVRRVARAEDLVPAVAAVLASAPAGAMVEEFLTGREFSVEAFSFAGEHRVVAVTEKDILANFVEVAHLVPARITDDERHEIDRLVETFLTAVGVEDGPTHTEVILTAAGPRIVESHNRPGGDRIVRLVELACGVSLIQWAFAWHYRLMSVPGRSEIVASRAPAIRFLVAPPGLVTRVTVPDWVRNSPALDELQIRVSVGDRVGELRDSWDRLGHVLVTADTQDDAYRLAARMAEAIVVETEPEQVDVAYDAGPAERLEAGR